ncbi:hypothetical protein ACOKFD_16885 [Flagellimonas sp. S174]|uniref:hypothetical protein n=1 Tax=Flagellimonas sp. S174 TaxID=3410790 RepID=UPI003BF58548
MKNVLFFTLVLLGLGQVASQTNIFPTSGNAGVGTTSPQAKLQVQGSGTIGGFWNPGNSFFTVSDGSNSMIMDSNEIYGSNVLYIGAKGSDIVKFRSVSDSGSAVDRMVIRSNGSIGVGTTYPVARLHVSSATSGDAVFRLEADTDNNNESDNPIIQFRQDGDIIGANVGFSESFGDNRFGIGTWHSTGGGSSWETFVIDIVTGNIGIGTNNISTNWKLAVKGKIRAEEIKVETGWADYVFKEDYELPSLEEVENHIKEKGHLINIPSAAEVKENGIQLGEMNKLLLEKIEELTLYVIALKKENEQIKETIKNLQK